MKICLAADKNYLQHLTVTMASVLKANPGESLEFIVLTDGSIGEDGFGQLEAFRDFDLRVVNAAGLVHDYMTVDADCAWPVAVFYRLILPFICPSDERIIYLDCDVVVRKPLRELWDLPMEGYAVAGVPDEGFHHKQRLHDQGIEIAGNYLNSGVMVWNLDHIRANGFADRLADVGRRLADPKFPDQDWINMMFDKEKLLLPLKWNAMSHIYADDFVAPPLYTESELATARRDPCVCHFTNVKPWTMSYTAHPYWNEYWECLGLTGFAGKRVLGRIKKLFFSSDRSPVFRAIRFVKNLGR